MASLTKFRMKTRKIQVRGRDCRCHFFKNRYEVRNIVNKPAAFIMGVNKNSTYISLTSLYKYQQKAHQNRVFKKASGINAN